MRPTPGTAGAGQCWGAQLALQSMQTLRTWAGSPHGPPEGGAPPCREGPTGPSAPVRHLLRVDGLHFLWVPRGLTEHVPPNVPAGRPPVRAKATAHSRPEGEPGILGSAVCRCFQRFIQSGKRVSLSEGKQLPDAAAREGPLLLGWVTLGLGFPFGTKRQSGSTPEPHLGLTASAVTCCSWPEKWAVLPQGIRGAA